MMHGDITCGTVLISRDGDVKIGNFESPSTSNTLTRFCKLILTGASISARVWDRKQSKIPWPWAKSCSKLWNEGVFPASIHP